MNNKSAKKLAAAIEKLACAIERAAQTSAPRIVEMRVGGGGGGGGGSTRS